VRRLVLVVLACCLTSSCRFKATNPKPPLLSDVRSLKISTPKSWQNAESIASDYFLDFLLTESDHFVADDEDEDDDDDEPVVMLARSAPGVKSKCKKPATGKGMAGAPIFEAMLRLVAVSIEEEETVVATAAANNKGVVSAVGMVVVVVGFLRNGIFWEDFLFLDPRPNPVLHHSLRGTRFWQYSK
jgi:hypothetical protein